MSVLVSVAIINVLQPFNKFYVPSMPKLFPQVFEGISQVALFPPGEQKKAGGGFSELLEGSGERPGRGPLDL